MITNHKITKARIQDEQREIKNKKHILIIGIIKWLDVTLRRFLYISPFLLQFPNLSSVRESISYHVNVSFLNQKVKNHHCQICHPKIISMIKQITTLVWNMKTHPLLMVTLDIICFVWICMKKGSMCNVQSPIQPRLE